MVNCDGASMLVSVDSEDVKMIWLNVADVGDFIYPGDQDYPARSVGIRLLRKHHTVTPLFYAGHMLEFA